jgi:hypothetical protein
VDRRSFIKYFSASAASAAASKTLASIPEAEKKILLLEPKIEVSKKKIAAPNEVVFSSVKEFEAMASRNLHQIRAICYFPGRISGGLLHDKGDDEWPKLKIEETVFRLEIPGTQATVNGVQLEKISWLLKEYSMRSSSHRFTMVEVSGVAYHG